MWVIDFVVYQWAKTKHKRSGLEWISWIVLAGCIVKCHFVGIIIFHCQRIVFSWWRICLNGNLACSSLKYGFCDASGKLLISFQGSYITLPGSLTLSCLFLERRHVALGSCHKKELPNYHAFDMNLNRPKLLWKGFANSFTDLHFVPLGLMFQ